MKAQYNTDIQAALKEQLGLPNVMMVPRLEKIVVNMGAGDAAADAKLIDGVVAEDGRIRIGEGELVYARSEEPTGTNVTLTLRPEKIQIHPRSDSTVPAERNQVPASVVRQLYFGESIYYELENIPSLRRWSVGDEVTMSFHREAAEALTS